MAFIKFKTYCGAVMEIRRREVLADRRIIDTTIWSNEEDEKIEEVSYVNEFKTNSGLNPFDAFEIEMVTNQDN